MADVYQGDDENEQDPVEVPPEPQLSPVEKLEVLEASEDDSNETPPSDIVAYNELRSCADIHRMHSEKILDIQPQFQREVVWNRAGQTRFIDSLVKQLPIPSMCFAYDYKTNRWIVIDGLQRAATIVKFLDGQDWKLATLPDIDPKLSGSNAQTIKNSKNELRDFYTRVQNQTLPINVLRCDLSKKRHNEYLFTIFHRLNSGGAKLNNQEIRNCIYSGPFNDMLKRLDSNEKWRKINIMKPDNQYRFSKQEWILRLFAFLDAPEGQYKGAVAKFLNDYMFAHRDDPPDQIAAKEALFNRIVSVVADKIFEGVEKPPRMPGTVLEAIMIGVASNLTHVESADAAHVRASYMAMRSHPSVSEESLAEGLSKPDKVAARFEAAKTIFAA